MQPTYFCDHVVAHRSRSRRPTPPRGLVLNIAVLLAPYARFDERGATAVDLCVRDGYLNSRYRATTRIHGPHNPESYANVDYAGLDNYPKGHADRSSLAYVRTFMARLKQNPVDLVVMQDDLRAAGLLASRLKTPVLFHTHTYMKRKKGFARIHRLSLYRHMAGMIFVSENARSEFRANWGTPCSGHVGLNGIDARLWNPAPADARNKEIVFVGRCLDWKGVAQLIEALPPVLDRYPDWRARFILSSLDQQPDYARTCLDKLKALGERVIVDIDLPHAQVKAVCEGAAIGIAPSTRNESFSRVSMEFMAGGAALVSSGIGGMREAGGEAALYCEPTPAALAATLIRLVADDDFRVDLARRGRARTSNELDIRRTTSAIDDIYDSVLANRAS